MYTLLTGISFFTLQKREPYFCVHQVRAILAVTLTVGAGGHILSWVHDVRYQLFFWVGGRGNEGWFLWRVILVPGHWWEYTLVTHKSIKKIALQTRFFKGSETLEWYFYAPMQFHGYSQTWANHYLSDYNFYSSFLGIYNTGSDITSVRRLGKPE